jgi:adenylate kinase family enzyme
MRRVAVLGCGGAGKTTLARAIANTLDLPLIHSDLYRPGWEEAHPGLIAGDAWVVDAMRLGTLDERLARADTAVFVDRGACACLWGIIRRRLAYRGGLHRESGVADFINWEFIRWVLTFRRRQRTRVMELLDSHAATTHIVVLRSQDESDSFLSSIAASRLGARTSQASVKRSRSSCASMASSRTSTTRE